MLAWASAQIHCQFHASENRVALPTRGNKQDVQAESDTVLIPSRGEHRRRTKKMLHSFFFLNRSNVFGSAFYLSVNFFTILSYRRTRTVCAGHPPQNIVLWPAIGSWREKNLYVCYVCFFFTHNWTAHLDFIANKLLRFSSLFWTWTISVGLWVTGTLKIFRFLDCWRMCAKSTIRYSNWKRFESFLKVPLRTFFI